MSRPNPDSKAAEDYRARQYETFQMIGSKPEDWRWDGSEPTENRDASGAAAGECGLCGKHPIAYEYTLVKKLSPMDRLIVGSECVSTFIDAEPWSAKRQAEEKMKRMVAVNRYANFLVKNRPLSYEQAKAEAEEQTTDGISVFFSNIARRKKDVRIKARAAALKEFIVANQARLWDQNWFYFRQRTILSSLSYMQGQWERGTETKWMDGPMNGALAKLGLSLPDAPKAEKGDCSEAEKVRADRAAERAERAYDPQAE